MKKIIFQNKDKTIGIITPSEEALSFATIKQIAEKDVPSPYEYPIKWDTIINKDTEEEEDTVVEWGVYNTPYWIVDETIIPSDRTFRNAWGIDESMGEPDGFGGKSNEFDKKLLKK